jgi:hypothetical protein
MPFEATAYRVFIASPSDVVKERKLIPEVIATWNANNSINEKVVLLPIMWETHSVPELGDRAQAIISQQLDITNCDILIALFCARLGSDTGVEASGTVEEIKKFIEAGNAPRVMLFFSMQVNQPFDKLDGEQIKKLQDFKSSMPLGIVGNYTDTVNLGDQIQRGLSYKVKWLAQQEKAISEGSLEDVDISQSHAPNWNAFQPIYPLNHEGGLLRTRDRFANTVNVERPDTLTRIYFNKLCQQKTAENITAGEFPDTALDQFKKHTEGYPIWEAINKFRDKVSSYENSMNKLVESTEQTAVQRTEMNRLYTGGYGKDSGPSLYSWFTVGLFDYALKLLEGVGPTPWHWEISPCGEPYPGIYILRSGGGNSFSDAAIGQSSEIATAKEVQSELLDELQYSKDLQSIYDEYKTLVNDSLEIKAKLKAITFDDIKKGHCRGCDS